MTKVYVDPMTGKSDKHLYSFCFDVKYFLSYFLEKVIFLKTFLAFGSYKKKINDEIWVGRISAKRPFARFRPFRPVLQESGLAEFRRKWPESGDGGKILSNSRGQCQIPAPAA